MISYEQFCQLRKLHDQDKLRAAQIARELNLDERTVAHWVNEKSYSQRQKTKRASQLDPFKGSIARLLDQHPYSASQILQRIREEGYSGGATILREHVAFIRPPTTRAFLPLQFAPGQAAQIDWGSAGMIQVGSIRRRLSFFVLVLCYSRRMYLEFTLREAQEHFLECHQNAFDYFGGVPAEWIVDNCKVAVLRHDRGQDPVFNPKYLDFARHHGCQIRACNPRSPHEKGRVERAVRYVRQNFLAGLELSSLEAVNTAAKLWLCTVANVRVHTETGKTPDALFAEERLAQVPVKRYDTATIIAAKANRCFRVRFESNRYSVPAQFAGTQLNLKTYAGKIEIWHPDHPAPIAEHPRSYERNQDLEHPDHAKPLLAQRFRANRQRNLMRFLQLGPSAEGYYEQLKGRQQDPGNHVARIVALSDVHGVDATVRALTDALQFQAYSAQYIANLLEQRQRKPEAPSALQLTRSSDLLDIELPEPNLSLYHL